MDDLILQSYLADFSKRFEYEKVPVPTQYEYMVAHCIVAKDYQGHFDAQDLSAGDANGIDSVAIFVNDVLIESPSEVASIAKQTLEAKFVFVQTKTSNSYDQGAVLKFTQAVRNFFSSSPKQADYPLLTAHEIKEAVYKGAIKFIENPRLELYYCTTASHTPNALLQETAATEIKLLESSNLFSSTSFQFIDAEYIKTTYRGLSNKVTKQILFEKHTILPKITGVKRAFIGILPCKEYLNLICDQDGKLLKNVFYDNVRDFQGENSVNREILSTLANEKSGGETFVLLNNGVTVVCKSINPVGIEFTVRDFQVVNGCQTSHILHRNSDLLKGNEFITIKLIETEDADLTNKITKATNRQTEVKLEAFAGLQPFHKELESFYSSLPIETRLYYERRPGQYDFDSSIPHSKVISIPNQIKSFVSVFLEEPHKIHFYYGQLLENYSAGDESTLFSETHDPFPYYIASRLAYLVNNRQKNKAGEKRWRYHLSAMIKLLAGGPFNTNRLSDPVFCKKYCNSVADKIHSSFDQLFDTANQILTTHISSARKANRSERDLPQDSQLAKSLLEECRMMYFQSNKKAEPKQNPTENFNGIFLGTIDQIVAEKRFGYIKYGERSFFFKLDRSNLSLGQRVRFKVKKIGREAEAFDITPAA